MFLWALYLLGCLRHRPRPWQFLTFHAAILLCVVAIFGPLDERAEINAAAHMTQHMLMMLAIAPLWVISQPLPQMNASRVGRGLSVLWQPLLKLTANPLLAATVHGIAIWFWHLPRFYVLALESPWWHAVEHLSFLVTAAIFTWAVLKSSKHAAPHALLAVLFTLMHTGVLGALLTFARAPLYVSIFTIDLPTADLLQAQQLAGLLMWVLGGIPYMAVSVWIMQRWFRQLLAYQ